MTAGQPTISANCEFLTTVKLNPADAATARLAIGLPLANPEETHHIVAPGAQNIDSSGGIHFVAVGQR